MGTLRLHPPASLASGRVGASPGRALPSLRLDPPAKRGRVKIGSIRGELLKWTIKRLRRFGGGRPKVLATSATILASLIAPLLILWLLGPALVGRDRLAFRDVGYFYTPLYQYVAEQTGNQIWPGLTTGGIAPRVWNDRENGGMSLAGETSTAVFYPVRHVVYRLIAVPEVALAWYVAIHLILASWTARWLTRRVGASPTASLAASVIYPLSGSVLFLASNPPFLVGAAWWPLAFGSLVVGRPRRSDVWIAGGSTAAMLLGGDPQAAAHLAITVAGVLLGRAVWTRKKDPSPLYRCLAAAAIAVLVAAPQLAASIDAAARSVRVGGGATPEAYAFSVAPWRHLEWCLPGVHGSPWPVNSRWDRAFWDRRGPAGRPIVDALALRRRAAAGVHRGRGLDYV